MTESGISVLLAVQYDGTDFCGSQIQPGVRTVQGTLTDTIAEVLGERPKLLFASRTDAGVHAYGQVISFCTTGSIPTERIPAAARGILPRDIAVLSAATMPPNFHARFSAIGKMYLYRVLNSQQTDPMLRNYVWQMERELNLDSMNRALSSLVGEHHFGAFQATGSSARNPVRTLYAARCIRREQLLEFQFHGNGFLYHMVRNIVGTAVDLGSGKISPDDFAAIFAGRDRKQAGATAPPNGLYLKEVFYEKP